MRTVDEGVPVILAASSAVHTPVRKTLSVQLKVVCETATVQKATLATGKVVAFKV